MKIFNQPQKDTVADLFSKTKHHKITCAAVNIRDGNYNILGGVFVITDHKLADAVSEFCNNWELEK